MAQYCASCGVQIGERARFCHRCGAPRESLGGPDAAGPRPALGANTILPWSVAGIALLCFLAFIVGQNWRRAQPPVAPVYAPMAGTGAGGRAPDISQLSPDERADRLFDRVMAYVAAGKSDSVLFFAPMAIQSLGALAPLTAHRRYDLGLIGVVSGDGALARAQADTILRAAPSHLLGLILGMRAAGLQRDTASRRAYADRFAAALTTERATRLAEYTDHGPDIDAAVRDLDARAQKTPR